MKAPLVPLSDCATIVGGATPRTEDQRFWGGDIPWATPKDISDLDGHYLQDTPRRITEAGLKSCAAQILPAGSVLFSSRAPIGHVAINAVPMATNQGFKSMVPKAERLDAKYLFHWLRTNRTRLEEMGTGATFKELSKKRVEGIEIPHPPQPEQRRISAFLDKADALIAKRQRTIARLDELAQAVFLEIFGDPVTNEKEWDVAVLAEVARTSSGGTPDRKRRDYYGGTIPWVKSGELHVGIVKATEECLTEDGLMNSAAKVVPAGTPIVAMYGATAGVSAILGIDAATNQAICAIFPGPRLNTRYLVSALRLIMPGLLNRRVGGAQPNLSQAMIRDLELPVPPIEVQQRFADCVESIDRTKSRLQEHHSLTGAVKSSLQRKAFGGDSA